MSRLGNLRKLCTATVISSSEKSYHNYQKYYNSNFRGYNQIKQHHWQLCWDWNELGSLSNNNCQRHCHNAT